MSHKKYKPKFKVGDHIQANNIYARSHGFHSGVIKAVAVSHMYYVASEDSRAYTDAWTYIARDMDVCCVLYDSPEGIWLRI